MGVSWTGASLRVDGLHQTPLSSRNAVAMEVIDSVVAIIPAKNVDTPVVDNRCMAISRRWWLRAALGHDLDPVIRLEAELEEIIAPIRTVVASKDIKVVFHCHRCVQ